MKKPSISVIMSVYNGEEFLQECIDSILEQDFVDFEFIIVDDASTDNTWQILQKNSIADKRIVLVRNKINLERSKSRNIAISKAKGKYIAVMDADDIALPFRLSTQYNFMENNSNISVLGSWIETFGTNQNEVMKNPTKDIDIRTLLLFECCMFHPTIMMKRDIFEKHYGYNEAMPPVEDFDLWCRLAMDNDIQFANIPEVLVKYRLYDEKDRVEYKKKQYDLAQTVIFESFSMLNSLVVKKNSFACDALIKKDKKWDSEEIKAVANWLESVLQDNRISMTYNMDILKNKLADIWFNYCWKSTYHGLWIWKYFFNSYLAMEKKITPLVKLKYLVKCLIRHQSKLNS